jgi:NAD(P)-dependent dehydrogenase (short-subunit alcohol dehydrogenase family)
VSEGFLDRRGGLAGRVAAIVGGGGGIGAAVTLALAGAGVDVVFCDIDGQASEKTKEAAKLLGHRAACITADATDAGELAGFYVTVANFAPRLDIVVNVVGGVRRGSFMERDAAEDAKDIRRNFGYIVDSIRHAVPLIRRGGRGGSIINFTTIEAHRGAATFAVYAGAKAATTNLTRALAVEFGADRIRLNALAPDTTPSHGNVAAMPTELPARMMALPDEARGAGMNMYIPMKQQPQLDDIANAVLFLASDLSAFVTGTTLHVDGGTMAAAGFLDWPFGDGFLPVPLDGTLGRMFR